MKKSLFTLLAMLMFGSVFAQTHYAEHYVMNAGLHQDNSTIFAVLYIDDVLFEGDYLEIGAYNVTRDEVAGGRCAHFGDGWTHDYPYFDLMYNGENGDLITFRLFDHQLNQELNYVTPFTKTFNGGDIDGGPANPFVFNFYSQGQEMHFIGQGDWNNLENWEGADRLPIALDNVFIDEGAICQMPESAIGQYATLTIEDGGQLYAPEDAEIVATVKKNIEAYDAALMNNWYLIAFPVDIDEPDFNTMITNSDYDLFFFDPQYSGIVENEESTNGEWRNYKYYMQHGLEFKAPYNAYLYANKQNTTLTFTGNLFTEGSKVYSNLSIAGAATEQKGVNLLGNPYTCYAEVTKGNSYITGLYKMLVDEDNAEAANRSDVVVVDPDEESDYIIIAPMTAVFAVASRSNNNTKVTFTPFNPEDHDGEIAEIIRGASSMKIELTANGVLKDRVYVKAGEGENCIKFNLNENSTKIFVPQNNKNYAIAYTEGANVMPLCFTTKENGIYTLNFNTKKMSCSYLHLIDNVTGVDIDLFQTPSYTFNSSDSNYANRFKLVFSEEATNEIAENFAFISNGELMINNSGNATLQVMDITGRLLSTENIEGSYSMSLNLNAGVYMVRLCNGNDVKVQKIVVE